MSKRQKTLETFFKPKKFRPEQDESPESTGTSHNDCALESINESISLAGPSNVSIQLFLLHDCLSLSAYLIYSNYDF